MKPSTLETFDAIPARMPSDALLLDYAAGALCEGCALVVATHIAMTEQSRRRLADLEAIGGALFERLEAASVSPDLLDRIMKKIDGPATLQRPHASLSRPMTDHWKKTPLPPPLCHYIAGDLEAVDLDALDWYRAEDGVEFHDLIIPPQCGNTRIMRIHPGRELSRHAHSVEEYTVILKGTLVDNGRSYGPGALIEHGENVWHSQNALGEEPCICLVALCPPHHS